LVGRLRIEARLLLAGSFQWRRYLKEALCPRRDSIGGSFVKMNCLGCREDMDSRWIESRVLPGCPPPAPGLYESQPRLPHRQHPPGSAVPEEVRLSPNSNLNERHPAKNSSRNAVKDVIKSVPIRQQSPGNYTVRSEDSCKNRGLGRIL